MLGSAHRSLVADILDSCHFMNIELVHEQDEGLLLHLVTELFYPRWKVVSIDTFILYGQMNKAFHWRYGRHRCNVVLHEGSLVDSDILFEWTPALVLNRPHAKAALILVDYIFASLFSSCKVLQDTRAISVELLSGWLRHALSLSDCLSPRLVLQVESPQASRCYPLVGVLAVEELWAFLECQCCPLLKCFIV